MDILNYSLGGKNFMRQTQKQRILSLLQVRGGAGVFTSELVEIANHYTTRINELVSVGYIIEAFKVADGEWKYILTYEPAEELEKKTAEAHLLETLNEFGLDGEQVLEIIDAYGLKVKYKNGMVKQLAKERKRNEQ
jgi:fructosamine-3-kinase